MSNIGLPLHMLTALSPLDGRYRDKIADLAPFFSEFALIRYRVFVEVQYFIALTQIPLPGLESFDAEQVESLNRIFEDFNEAAAERVKTIERTTNHDVKAVEYFLKEEFLAMGLGRFAEFIHFGLTSQDINNTATPLMLKQAHGRVMLPELDKIISELRLMAAHWLHTPMLARTHGQPASPTTMGKELMVFAERLEAQRKNLLLVPFQAKFGGATGNFNAHVATYPLIDWPGFANGFTAEFLGLQRQQTTTQIEHYDNMAAYFDAMRRINNILVDLCRDVWSYVSLDYFKQKVVAGEIGSSAMPHKVNPIDFENAEGNLMLANAVFTFLSDKLPVSRLQRDLTDSTVLRNAGVPLGHTLIAYKSILKGLSKLLLNEHKLYYDLENNWMVIAEGIQTILRREGYPKPYEALKELTRGRDAITQNDLRQFIESLRVSHDVKDELYQLSPHTYTGTLQTKA